MSARNESVVGLGKTRVESLTDGIFSAVMTVLGLNLTLPYITATGNVPLPNLNEIGASILIYMLSFFILAVFWVGDGRPLNDSGLFYLPASSTQPVQF